MNTGPRSETEAGSGSPELDIFEVVADGQLVCRVCGALVPRQGDYRRVHWDWHEATNGA